MTEATSDHLKQDDIEGWKGPQDKPDFLPKKNRQARLYDFKIDCQTFHTSIFRSWMETSDDPCRMRLEELADRPFSNQSKSLEQLIEELHDSDQKEGEYAAIEPDTLNVFFGTSVKEALRKAEEEFPNQTFRIIRVGHDYVYDLT